MPRATNVAHYAKVVREDAGYRELIKQYRRRSDAAYAREIPLAMLVTESTKDLAEINPPSSDADAELFRTATETCRHQDMVEMILAPYLPAGSIGSLVAKIKIGKTSLILEMVRCLTARIGFCGFPPQAETPRGRIRSILSGGAKTVKEIATEMKVSVQTVMRTIEDMAGDVIKVGRGGPRNNADLYGLREKTTTFPIPIS